ncbi:MAG: hypothetical protein AABZ67_04980 [Pseudomonadota bacterium]
MKKYLKTICYAFFSGLILAPLPALAQQKAAKAPATQKGQKAQKTQHRGRPEKLYCTLGTEDRQARIAVEVLGGKVQSIAYYSKWKPRTCSMHIIRDDAYSKWEDTGNHTVVSLIEDKGAFLIDHESNRLHFIFRNIDRERFCGMEGKINGSLTVWRGKPRCGVEGVMDENPPELTEKKP